MTATTLQDWLDANAEPETLTVQDEHGKDVAITLRHPSRSQTEEVYRLIGQHGMGVGEVKQVNFAAIAACVEGATEENIPRIAALGGEKLEKRLYDLIGLGAPERHEGEAQAVGNSHSGIT